MRGASYQPAKNRVRSHETMRSGPALFLSLFLSTVAYAAGPRVTFERLVPAPHDLHGAQEVAVIGAIGDTLNVELLVEHFVEQTNRAGTLRIQDARDRRHAMLAAALRKSQLDAFVAIRAFTCTSNERTGPGSTLDPDGKRIVRPMQWIEARCTARVEALTADGVRSSFAVKGEASSPHVVQISDEEREDALQNAARFTAIDAAEKISPRRVRESIPLDETSPAFEEGYAMVEGGRFAEARAIWERELRRQPRAAALHFNLAAVCEALGDRKAAEQHYLAAGTLAPQEKRYTHEYKSFVRRTH
jgi:tetratricopeptide (TPR) repeat protein